MQPISVRDMPQHARPREKLVMKGPAALADHELLAIILRKGYQGKNVVNVAKGLLSKYPLSELAHINVDQLKKMKGVGSAGSLSIIALVELARRLYHKTTIPCIRTPEDAERVLTFIRSKKREHFVALYLNARQQLIKTHTISIGTIDASLAHPREILEPAIRLHASSFILAHNHPSGDPDPSQADLVLTKRIIEASRIMGIDMVDHIILTKTHSMSFRQQEFL